MKEGALKDDKQEGKQAGSRRAGRQRRVGKEARSEAGEFDKFSIMS